MKPNIFCFGIVVFLISFLFCAQSLFASTNSWEEEKKLVASNAGEQDWFGWTVAIAGDVAIVGAYKEDTGGNNAGAAYIYERSMGGSKAWGEVKKLTASDAKFGDFFGYSVAIEGNLAFVGATGADIGTNGTGAVYIFEQNAGGANAWGEVKKLTASDAQTYDSFGQAVAIVEDVAIIGTVNEKAYIFERNQGGANNWGEVKKLVASDTDAGDWFGRSVSVTKNVAIVGAKLQTGGGDIAGAAYLCGRSQGGANAWGEIKKLTASYAQNFGVSVAIAGDVVIVGADTTGAGAAYIFGQNAGAANNWGLVKKLISSDPGTFDQFGYSVAVEGNFAFVGAPFKDYGAETWAGAAYVFERNLGGANAWGQTKKLLASIPGNSDFFGNSISVDGGIAIVGAYNDRSYGHQAGAAYVFASAPPPSQAFTNAPPLPDNSQVASGNNTDATIDPGEPEHAGNGGPYHSVWWDWSEATSALASEAAVGDILLVDTHGSDFDTVLAVYTGPTVSNLTIIATNDNSGTGIETSEVYFQFNPGETYHITVDGKTASDTGNIVLNYAIIPEPTIFIYLINFLFLIFRSKFNSNKQNSQLP